MTEENVFLQKNRKPKNYNHETSRVKYYDMIFVYDCFTFLVI